MLHLIVCHRHKPNDNRKWRRPRGAAAAARFSGMSRKVVFRRSKLMGHADVKITQKTYAHFAPEAWHQGYHRLAFHVPSEPARVFEIVRDHRGKLAGRRSITVDARETADPGGSSVREIRSSFLCRSL